MLENVTLHLTNQRLPALPDSHTIKFYSSQLRRINKSYTKVFITACSSALVQKDYIEKLLLIRKHLDNTKIRVIVIYDYDSTVLPIALKIYELSNIFVAYKIHYLSNSLCNIS
jgi:hypothetical protein